MSFPPLRFLLAISCATLAASAQPATEAIMLFKGSMYDQVSASQTILRQAGFASIVIADAGNVSVLRPGGSDTLQPYSGVFTDETDFSSVATMEANYPDATYTVRISGGHAVAHDVAVRVAGPMPAPLRVTNYDEGQAIPNGTPFTLTWTAVPGATDADLFQVTLQNNSGSFTYDTPGVAEPGVLSGTTTNVVLSLPPNDVFTADITFMKLSEGDARVVNANALKFAGVLTRTSFLLRTVVPPPKPQILTQPNSTQVSEGMPAQLGTWATISGGETPRYQWYHDGQLIPGATDARYDVASARRSDMGFYWATVRSDLGTEVRTDIGILTVAAADALPGRLINLSARAGMRSGSEVFAGFSIRGSVDKSVLLRGVGPQLWNFGLQGIADPQVRLYRLGDATPIASNDDWGGGADLRTEFDRCGAFPLSGDTKSAVLSLCLPCAGAQSYSMRVANVASGSGTTIAEIYDTDPDNRQCRLFNLSARAIVGSGDDLMVCGFVIGGPEPAHVLVRAIGPGLHAFGIGDAIADPRFAIVPLGRSYTVATNNDWSGATTLSDAFDRVGAFGLQRGSKDAALDLWLPPGGYTVTVTGADGTAGSAIVEIYDLSP